MPEIVSLMAKKTNGDRISNLPDSILSRILSSLPIKDAVSTSILSNGWRHLFASVYNLDVDFELFPSSHRTIGSLPVFLDKMLFFHTEGIERSRLNRTVVTHTNSSDVCRWISAALHRGVKDLDLDLTPWYPHYPVTLPATVLFLSKTLLRLKLHIRSSMTVPDHVLLPSLKTLDLRYIRFEDDDSVKRLISSCPVLEDLSFSECDMRHINCLEISNPSLKSLVLVSYNNFSLIDCSIAIDLPSLVYFKYVSSSVEKYSMVNMPSLVRADIDICFGRYPGLANEDRDPHALVQLSQGIGNAKSLHLRIYPEALPFLSNKRVIPLENLVHLEIYNKWKVMWKGRGLFEFLEISPNLQTLVISKVSNEVSLPMEKVASCILYQLKEFKVVYDYDYEMCLFKMVAYILNNAAVLEKLTIFTNQSLELEEKFRITKELMSLPRSSKKCRVTAF